MSPTVTLTLQCLDMKDLRKRYKENEKNIQATFEKYKDRYTTKANITIYRLMVIALSAELQNVLNNVGFGKLDDALNDIKTITNKYYVIAADGNQSIAPTVKKFIGELDYLSLIHILLTCRHWCRCLPLLQQFLEVLQKVPAARSLDGVRAGPVRGMDRTSFFTVESLLGLIFANELAHLITHGFFHGRPP